LQSTLIGVCRRQSRAQDGEKVNSKPQLTYTLKYLEHFEKYRLLIKYVVNVFKTKTISVSKTTATSIFQTVLF